MVQPTLMIPVGRADQGEVALIGNGEEDPAVGQLEEIGMIVIEQARHDDVRSAHQPNMAIGRPMRAVQQVEHGRAGGVDDGPCT
ncbi:hypothetical protein LTR94_035597, partial [Friedmanniomyces endolithicus]